MTTSTKRSALLSVGLVLLIVGLLAAIGLWYSAGQRQADAVRNMARAPSGCDTTLDFEAAGEFTIYIETAGRFDDPVAGDCVAEGAYGVVGDGLPALSLVMTSPDGDEVELANASGVEYDSDGFTGQSVRTFDVDTPGDYVLRVEVPGDGDVQIAVAVGRDPSDGVGTMQLGAVLAAVAGLLVGGGLMFASRRSGAAPDTAPGEPWPAEPAGWPTAPPGMPAAPAPAGWQPAVGPPSHAPAVSPPLPGVAPPAPVGWSTPPGAADSPPPAPDGGTPTWAPAPSTGPTDGSSGDGQRSPWAPPNDAAH